jgi:pyruvate,water dikinase
MLGFRGASRYYSQCYRAGFALECQAMTTVREELGLTNVKLMIPFCRTMEEWRLVLAEMEQHGFKCGEKGFEIYVMCELPGNVVLADAFAEVFDGLSIGSNDLTQLVLGVDRDSEIVAHLFDEKSLTLRLVCPRDKEQARNQRMKVLCAIDGSRHSAWVLELLPRLCCASDSSLFLIHAVDARCL